MDPPKRERKRVVNYAENEYYRQAMKTGGGPRASGLRLPKMPQLQASRPSSSPSFCLCSAAIWSWPGAEVVTLLGGLLCSEWRQR